VIYLCQRGNGDHTRCSYSRRGVICTREFFGSLIDRFWPKGREIGIYGLEFHVTVGGLNMRCRIVRGARELGGWTSTSKSMGAETEGTPRIAFLIHSVKYLVPAISV